MVDPVQADVDFPFPVFKASGKDAFQTWKHLTHKTGQTAVILGQEEELEYLTEALEYSGDRSAQDILEAAKNLDFPQQFQEEKYAEMKQFIEEYGDKTELDDFGDLNVQRDIQTLVENWPEERIRENPQSGPSILRHWDTNDFHQEVFITVLPTDDPTEIPAYLKYGHFNDCPAPEWHVAAARYWRDKYGAQIVANSHDTIEMIVTSRPSDKTAAATLAFEQYAYCSDIVDQGIGEPGLLAKSLMKTDWWYFWWD